jgi:hypothetical protein
VPSRGESVPEPLSSKDHAYAVELAIEEGEALVDPAHAARVEARTDP